MSGLRLFIQPINDAFADLYRTAANAYNTTPYDQRNSGFDLHCDFDDMVDNANSTLMGQGCRAVAMDAEGRCRGFWLVPRSSISKTLWRLANSIGLIDATYRGVVKAALCGNYPMRDKDHLARYVQLAAGDLIPWAEIIVVDELPGGVTVRGEGGFGSSGR